VAPKVASQACTLKDFLVYMSAHTRTLRAFAAAKTELPAKRTITVKYSKYPAAAAAAAVILFEGAAAIDAVELCHHAPAAVRGSWSVCTSQRYADQIP
jgi:hypothetical protein